MKISNEELSRLLAYAPQERSGSRAGVGSSVQAENVSSVSHAAAEINLSSNARDIQLAKKAIADVPDVREDRVRALKAQIENGTYHVSGNDIADLILRRTLADNTAL